MDAFSLDRVLKVDEFELRRFCRSDAETVFETVVRNREHLQPFMHWMVPEYSIDSAREFIESSTAAADNRESLGFGIFLDKELLGSIGFVNFDWKARRTEIGYWIAKDREGTGIVSRSCVALIDLAFRELEMNRIEIRCAAKNTRSAAIPKKFGFTLEGCLRQAELRNGELHDFLIFGLLRTEWEAVKKIA